MLKLIEYLSSGPALANEKAEALIGDHMLLAWYHKDRDFESLQHVSEWHIDSEISGYIAYALYHGASLKVEIEKRWFVFFDLLIDF